MFQKSIHPRQSRNTKCIGSFSYEEEDILGKGNQATVFKGKNIEKKNQVAIKVINAQNFGFGIQKKLLDSQIKILQALKGKPFILNTIDVIETLDQIYIVTQLCYGDLCKRTNKKLQQGEAWKYLRQMIKGYKSIYENKIIHRDLKPDNLLLNAKGQIKIGDFGFAISETQARKQCYYNIGSPQYMAPEALKKNQYSYMSDIWAIGMIFYEMLTGLNPWKNKKQEFIEQKLNEQFILRMLKNSSISSKAYEFLCSALAYDVQKRMTPEELIIFQIQISEVTPLRINKSDTIIKPKLYINCEEIVKTTKIVQNPQSQTCMNFNKKSRPSYYKKQATQRKIYIKKQSIKTELAHKRNKSITTEKMTVNQAGSISQNLMFKINICQGLFAILSKMKSNSGIKLFLKRHCFDQCNLIFICYSNLIIKTLHKIIDFQTNNFLQIPQVHLKKFVKSVQYGKIMKICEDLIKKYSKSEELKQQWTRAKEQNVIGAINTTKTFLNSISKNVKFFNIQEMLLMKIVLSVLPLLECLQKNSLNRESLEEFLGLINQKNKKNQSQYFEVVKEVKEVLKSEK